MKKLAFALLLAVAVAGCGDKVPRLSPVGQNDVIVAFGDSLTYGTGASESESYPAVLAQIARLQEVIDEHRPALMIVCLGGNDMLRHAADAQIQANLREIIKTIRGQGISAMLVGVPKPALVTSAAPFYAELASEFGIPYEGAIVTDVLYQRDLKSDPIHPNAKGYRRMAEAIAKLLKKAGAI
jgi:acyl-CoA thioesterase-1